jgi:LPS-assembly protein
MQIRRKTHKLIKLITFTCAIFLFADTHSQEAPTIPDTQDCQTSEILIPNSTLTKDAIAKKLGWTIADNRCGGYYFEDPFSYSNHLAKNNLVQITNTGPVLFAPHGTSVLQGNVTATQLGQEVIANKAYIYRDPKTNKLMAIDLIGNVHLREPDTLVLAQKARIDYAKSSQSLQDIIYRTAIYSNPHAKPATPSNDTLQLPHKVTQLSAWGEASEFSKTKPHVFEFKEATYSTCPPEANVWEIKAKHIILDKNTGRGTATHARLYIKKTLVFYAPYLNFAIDDRRQTGFLRPTFGSSGKLGPYVSAPFYWNIAPNYDDTLTPLFAGKRGWQYTNLFRYLTPSTIGRFDISVAPNDKAFSHFQTKSQETYKNNPSDTVQANLRRLQNDGSARGAISWQNNTQLNAHWGSSVDYNYVSDDYFLRDYRTDISEVTQNQLLQTGNVAYKGQNWNFMTRILQYQTLNPVDEVYPFQTQYSRLPQFVIEGDYPDQALGLDYFVMSDLTHFTIRETPGESQILPIGNRLHAQPGVSLPMNWPYLFITPRVQLAMTEYDLGHPFVNGQTSIYRSIPIFDLGSGLYFDRNVSLFGHHLQQTLEPQAYYTYVPYRNQTNIPNFDTTLNTLTYDQLFTYNRFSGLDRFGDANQLAVGLTSRFLDPVSSTERIRLGLGQIFYFSKRRVTLCTADAVDCPGPNIEGDNKFPRSPLSGMVSYLLSPGWTLNGNAIWNSELNEMDNQSIALTYSPQINHVINLGYTFVRQGDATLSPNLNSPDNNLKQADIGFTWPIFTNWSAIGHITKSINRDYFQRVVFGLQYDSCCWAVRAIAGRTFVNIVSTNLSPQFTREFYIQFALRGLGNFGAGSGDTSKLVSGNTGVVSDFGRDY